MDTNQDTGIVPVTEDNMREYFQRVVDHVASLSTQAKQVEGLRQDVAGLTQRIGDLEAANTVLMDKLTAALDRNRQLEAESSQHREAAVAANEHAVALRDTIVARDTAVANLSQSYENEKASHRVTVADRDDARQRSSELQAKLDDVNAQLAAITADRDHWLETANTHYESQEAYKKRLDSIQQFLYPQAS